MREKGLDGILNGRTVWIVIEEHNKNEVTAGRTANSPQPCTNNIAVSPFMQNTVL